MLLVNEKQSKQITEIPPEEYKMPLVWIYLEMTDEVLRKSITNKSTTMTMFSNIRFFLVQSTTKKQVCYLLACFLCFRRESTQLSEKMSWPRLVVSKAVEIGNKNNLTCTGGRSFRSVKKSIYRLEEAVVSCRGPERLKILRMWVLLLKEVERLKLSQGSGDDSYDSVNLEVRLKQRHIISGSNWPLVPNPLACVTQRQGIMSLPRLAVSKAVEVSNKNNLTCTVRNYADSVVQLGGRSFRRVKKIVSCRGPERLEILRRWVLLLKEVERLKLSQGSGDDSYYSVNLEVGLKQRLIISGTFYT
ncbi:hypothetical protein DVH24_026724 [Malus domestica]|uniref:Uncharacterized protein n=1 Tax=Malus domestica TaxID=3750 RepID=A0A498K7C1_MALDO|nr:hypothetical protein DVH24_026724 [Malus domestica]